MTMRPEDTIDLSHPEATATRELLAAHAISLKPSELERVRELLGRDPSIVELHIFNVMWSEHCSYKSSKAILKKYLPTNAPHVVLGPGEDAGIVRVFQKGGRSYCLVMAHESHNHPSQVLPVEGAATGIGGIVRDVYCMGADVIAVLDPLRFGDPDGRNGRRVRDIVRGVVDGIAEYGNALGVPNYGGEAYFDKSFDDNCLVNVVALGLVEEGDIVRSRAPEAAAREAYDIVLIGKPTDASGFGGAAFASQRLSGKEAEERQEAVQVPDPFLKRVLAEASKVVLAEARRRGLAIGFKDLGAGGISCAVSEMAQAGGVGASVDLSAVRRFPDALPPEVIACSETQERYAMFVPSHFTDFVCRTYNSDYELPHIYADAGAVVIGHTTPERRFKIFHDGRLVCDADVEAITTGIEYAREASPRKTSRHTTAPDAPGPREALLRLLASFNLADRSILFQHYDSEVQGRAVLRPGEADAAVGVFVPGEGVGLAAGVGSNSAMGEVDPYLGGAWSVVEAVRNVACVGARALAVTDCLNFGDPEDPEVFWEFSEAVRGIGDACRALRLLDGGSGIPVISGNVSFYNQSEKGRPIAPTPIVACVGRVDDLSRARSLAFKRPGSRVVLVGRLHGQLGGSEYAKQFGAAGAPPPVPDLDGENGRLLALIEGIECGALLAAHDVAQGGLLVTCAEMSMASAPYEIGCSLRLEKLVPEGDAATLFSEYGGVVVEVDAARDRDFETLLERRRTPWVSLGVTTEAPSLSVELGGSSFALTIEALRRANVDEGRLRELFG